jgi:hypothetical protein
MIFSVCLGIDSWAPYKFTGSDLHLQLPSLEYRNSWRIGDIAEIHEYCPPLVPTHVLRPSRVGSRA